MLKSKTPQPLHGAVRLMREDVVFLCLVENHANVSQFYFMYLIGLIMNVIQSYPIGDSYQGSYMYYIFFTYVVIIVTVELLVLMDSEPSRFSLKY